MGKNRRCCVGNCDNDERYPAKVIRKPHVASLTWHKFPKNKIKFDEWVKAISKGRQDFDGGKYTHVCSNHFLGGEPKNGPPTLYLTPIDELQFVSNARPALKRREMLSSSSNDNVDDSSVVVVSEVPEHVPMQFSHITREYDVRFLREFPVLKCFKVFLNLC